jgi:hypothetical protein
MSPGRVIGWSAEGDSSPRATTSARSSARLGERDARCSAQARYIQESRRGWLVMWSAWHRTFTAFSCFAPVPLVLDEPTPEALLNQMRHAELYYSAARGSR